MIWRKAMKYPMLIAGIIMFVIFVTDNDTQSLWYKYKYRFIPNTCQTVLDRSESQFPSEWKVSCPGTELMVIEISITTNASSMPKLRQLLYRTLANAYVLLANKTNIETFEMLKNIHINIKHPQIDIHSESSGHAVAKFYKMTNKAQISEHLKTFVRVQEKMK